MCFSNSYLTVFNFIIPCEAGEKISYGVTIFLSQTVNLMLVAELMPRGGKSVPILGQYLLISIIFIVMCLFFSIQIIAIYFNPYPEIALGKRKLKFTLTRLRPILGPNLPRKMQENQDLNSEIETAIANLQVNGNSVLKDRILDQNGNHTTITSSQPVKELPVTASKDGRMSEREQAVIACETLNNFGLAASFTFFNFAHDILYAISNAEN